MSATSEFYPPPNQPDDFEALCRDLFQVIWNDPGAQLHGRRGQKQDGVDLYGKHGGRLIGVQCKQKDGLLRREVTIKELDDEVNAAKRFEPGLKTFIPATTGPTDEKVQKRALALSEASDPPFEVEVWSRHPRPGQRALTSDPDGARADLDEAWEIAVRGPMPLFQADVLLHRARLFEDRAALGEARRLIKKHGYGRRLGELEDAEAWLGKAEP